MVEKISSNIIIRSIKKEDYNDLKHLLRAGTNYHMEIDDNFKKMVEDNKDYFDNELNETLRSSKNGDILVCEFTQDNISKVVGLLVYRYEDNGNIIYISDLYIQTPYRGHGYATALLNYLVKKYPNKQIGLMCMVKNTTGYNFYKKYGFKVIETLKGKKYNITSHVMCYKKEDLK